MLNTFSTEQYADVLFILGVFDDESNAASAEYQRWYSNRRIPNPRTIVRTFSTLIGNRFTSECYNPERV
ncbi:hypothetical protein ANN_01545 [Periplaneta americana]|uniref:DUF4817 domain-containing protein n=1 Tax=Periplaneta americana TaxID=6978 RepID=A0ABQ8TWB0_PERAM|nr:hypothetical protein ANN_01545 [Periplaneta americana]